MGLFFSFLILVLLRIIAEAFIFPTPFSDLGTVRYRSIPYMTFALIIINSLVFMILQAPNLYQGSALYAAGDTESYNQGLSLLNNYIAQSWTYGYRGLFMREGLGIGAFVTFTSMFMHGDLWHLLYNMIYLWTFGRRIEDACGSWRFLMFYLLAGMIAGIGSEIFNVAHADVPSIGASGAIAGVMGAYLVLFPGAMVSCFWGIGILLRVPVVLIMKVVGIKSVKDAPIFRRTIKLPAIVLLLLFLGLETVQSLIPFLQEDDVLDGVNHAAHVTGFLAALVIFLFVKKDLLTRYFSGRKI
jgi:membrane associated rhomboid family serine protease